MTEVAGKVALVTGGAGGIGAALAQGLVEGGARVMVADLDLDRARDVAAELGVGSAAAVRLDVTKSEDWEEASANLQSTFGPCDLLFSNAGVSYAGALDTLDIDAWRWTYDVNVIGTLHGLRSLLPAMKAGGREGHVVLTCSVTALHPMAGYGAYTSSKAALLNLATVLKQELAGTRIGVTAVCPGLVGTDLPKNAFAARPGHLKAGEEPPRRSSGFAGMAPATVATRVIDAVRNDRFFVFTHGDYAVSIARDRDLMLEAIGRGADPSYREPDILIEPLPR